jgi:hypothetical protein
LATIETTNNGAAGVVAACDDDLGALASEQHRGGVADTADRSGAGDQRE